MKWLGNKVVFSARDLVAIGVVLTTVLTLSVHGQRRTVTEAEIDNLLKSATAARQSLAYRLKLSTFSARPSDTEVTRNSVSLTEIVPPDRLHTILEYRPSSSSDLVRNESIRIGDRSFIRQRSGEWTVGTTSSSGQGGGYGTGVGTSTPIFVVECHYVGSETINGKLVDVYQKVRTTTFERPDGNMVDIMTKRYWFDRQGLLVKEVHDNHQPAPRTTPFYRLVWEYEYDPTIRIEPPAVTVSASRQAMQAIRAKLVAAMKKSFDLTADASYRARTTVETGSSSTGKNWSPYSSWVIEGVFPDLFHLAYTSGRRGDFVWMGKTKYSSEEANGDWLRTEEKIGRSPQNPASAIGLSGPNFEFYDASAESGDSGVTVFRVVKNPVRDTADFEPKIVTWTYWFDERGLLFKHDSIGYNGRNWVRTTENYEYDPTIKIDVPISN
jgi:hypothetical protein